MHHDHHHHGHEGHGHKHNIPAECPASKCPELSATAAPAKCPVDAGDMAHITKIKEVFNMKSDVDAVKMALAWTAHMASAHPAVGKKDDACCDTKKSNDCCDAPKAKAPSHGMGGGSCCK